ncbi:MAG: hypothetical protein NTY13_03285 [Chlamydiae bacterium]|nr:hypothetical protein [Chlamydiota bacterium]
MPKFTLICFIFTLLIGVLPAAEEMVLALDRLEDLTQFRSFADSEDPSLKDLQASASAQFTEIGLLKLKEKYASKSLMVVDLRRESHGFVDGLPISWFLWDTNWSNIGLSIEEISYNEDSRLALLRREKKITIQRISIMENKRIRIPIPVTVTSTATESNLAAREGLGYLRVPISDHKAPEVAQINQIITLFKTKPASGWLHFHGKTGRGRTAVILAMWDMLHNAKKDSFENILAREKIFSSYNIKTNPIDDPYFTEKEMVLYILKSFYEYCRSNKNDYTTPFDITVVN